MASSQDGKGIQDMNKMNDTYLIHRLLHATLDPPFHPKKPSQGEETLEWWKIKHEKAYNLSANLSCSAPRSNQRSWAPHRRHHHEGIFRERCQYQSSYDQNQSSPMNVWLDRTRCSPDTPGNHGGGVPGHGREMGSNDGEQELC